MPTATSNTRLARGQKIQIRVTPEIRQALKVAAAEKGTYMEGLLHSILCQALNRHDLMEDRPLRPYPKSTSRG